MDRSEQFSLSLGLSVRQPGQAGYRFGTISCSKPLFYNRYIPYSLTTKRTLPNPRLKSTASAC